MDIYTILCLFMWKFLNQLYIQNSIYGDIMKEKLQV